MGFGPGVAILRSFDEAEARDFYLRYLGFEVVFDSVGGANMANSFAAAALNGHVASTVALCELDLSMAHFKGLSLHVIFMLIPMLHNFKREIHAEILRNLTQIVESGGLKPVLDENHYSLDQAGQAYARLESGQAMGKVVVENNAPAQSGSA